MKVVACVDTSPPLPLRFLSPSPLPLIMASLLLLPLPLPPPLPVAVRTSVALTACETRLEMPALREVVSLEEGAG
jgi:hypothetical protein